MHLTVGSALIRLIRGDITQQDTAAIVNAANSGLLGGGGVDGAIHSAGGPQILEECRAIRAARGILPAGEAVATTGGRLRARFVVHTVGPVWRGGNHQEGALLRKAYWNSLRVVHELAVSSVSFPCISTGAYGFPVEQGAKIALATVHEFLLGHPGIHEVRMVTYSGSDYETYARLFAEPAEWENSPPLPNQH